MASRSTSTRARPPRRTRCSWTSRSSTDSCRKSSPSSRSSSSRSSETTSSSSAPPVAAASPAFYESYLNQLTEGSIRNQGEQTNEENKSVSTQTELGPPVEVGLQHPDISHFELPSSSASANHKHKPEPAASKPADSKLKDQNYKNRLLSFLEDRASTIKDVLEAQNSQLAKTSAEDVLEIPKQVRDVCPSFSVVKDEVFLNERLNCLLIVKVVSSHQLANSKLPAPHRNSSLLIEYMNCSVSNMYITEDDLTCSVLLEDIGQVVAADSSGCLHLFAPKNRNKKLSEVLGSNVYKELHRTDDSDSKRHLSPVKLLRLSKSGEEVYSVDSSGRLVVWQVLNKRGSLELSAINYVDLNTEVSQMAVDSRAEQVFVGSYSSLFQLSTSINPSLPVSIRSSNNSSASLSAIFATSLDIVIAGYDNGDVRLFIDIHKDAVFRLPTFTKARVVLVFPGNYSKVDKVSRKVTTMECLASVNVLDCEGRLHIFDLEDKIGDPEKVVPLLPGSEKSARVLTAAYDMERSQLVCLCQTQEGLKAVRLE